MPFILTLIIGAAIGFVATRLMKIEANVFVTIAIGVVGAILGMLLLRTLAAVIAMGSGIVPMFVGGVGGALIILWIYKAYVGK